MIDDFLGAFGLFADAWTTMLLLALLLPLLGVVMLLREQVFLGAAVAQAAGMGYALALWAGFAATDGHDHDLTLLASGWLAAVVTAWSVLRSLTRRGTEMEARAAVVFLLGGSWSMLLLAGDPRGAHEVQRMFLSSILGAHTSDVAIAAVLLAASVCGIGWRGRAVALWAVDPLTAAAHGSNLGRLDFGMGLWLGTILAFAIHVAGLPFAFGAAVLPALGARELGRSLRAVTCLAVALGLAGAVSGLVLAHAADRPPAQAVVGVDVVAVLSARGILLVRRRVLLGRT